MYRFIVFLSFINLFVSCDHPRLKKSRKPFTTYASPIIYGENDILDYYQVRSKKIRHMGRSVAIQIPNYRLHYEGSEYLINQEFLEDLNICRGHDDFHEKLAGQPSLGSCTGFLVEEDVLLTASHCVESFNDCRDNYWVFNFKSDERNLAPTSFNEQDVYNCKEVIKQDQSLDYAFLKLNRPVLGRAPLKLRQRGKILSHSRLVVIGYPQGLPLKFSNNAKIRSNENKDHFVINSDTFEGNSGSPVINKDNNLVEGVLVRGGTDFDIHEKSEDLCHTIKRCPEGQCSGEEILRVKSIYKSNI